MTPSFNDMLISFSTHRSTVRLNNSGVADSVLRNDADTCSYCTASAIDEAVSMEHW